MRRSGGMRHGDNNRDPGAGKHQHDNGIYAGGGPAASSGKLRRLVAFGDNGSVGNSGKHRDPPLIHISSHTRFVN